MKKIPLHLAQEVADTIREQLLPHCHRCEIAGSIRRQESKVSDIEIVCIPKPYDIGLFRTGIATVIEDWEKVKGTLPCKYTQRRHPSGMKVDIFMCKEDNWGYIYAIRTGSVGFIKKAAQQWVSLGYKGKDGYLHSRGKPLTIPTEEKLFEIIRQPYLPPSSRI